MSSIPKLLQSFLQEKLLSTDVDTAESAGCPGSKSIYPTKDTWCLRRISSAIKNVPERMLKYELLKAVFMDLVKMPNGDNTIEIEVICSK